MNFDLRQMSDITRLGLPDVVFVGAALGGIGTLRQVLSSLSPDFPAAVVVIPRLDGGAPATLSKLLATHSVLPVVEVKGGEPIEAARVYVAPLGQRLVIRDDHFSRRATVEPASARHRLDPLFVSAALAYKGQVVGVAMAGCDIERLRAARPACDLLIGQDPDTNAASLFVPSEHLEEVVDLVLAPEEIGPTLDRYTRETRGTGWSERRRALVHARRSQHRPN